MPINVMKDLLSNNTTSITDAPITLRMPTSFTRTCAAYGTWQWVEHRSLLVKNINKDLVEFIFYNLACEAFWYRIMKHGNKTHENYLDRVVTTAK